MKYKKKYIDSIIQYLNYCGLVERVDKLNKIIVVPKYQHITLSLSLFLNKSQKKTICD